MTAAPPGGLPVAGGLVDGAARIVVLRANALGDFIFSLPALDALRAAYPDAEITLLGAPWHARFLAGRAAPEPSVGGEPLPVGRPAPVDRVGVVPALPGIRDPDPGEPSPVPDELRTRFLSRERDHHYDLAVQLHGGGRHTNPFVTDLGARVTAGLRAPQAPPLDRWVRYDYYQPEVFRYLEVVGLVGAGVPGATPADWRPRLVPTGADLAEAESVAGVPERPRVVIHPGASDPRRRWPPDRFAAVGDALAGAGAEVVVTGTPPEREVVDEVIGRMRAAARALVGGLSLGGLAGLLAGCAVVVANDTGPLHLAAAVGAGTVGIYWVGNMINGAPMERTRHRPMTSWTLHCPECGQDCTRDLYPDRVGGGGGCAHRPSFVADVATAEVRDAAVELLASGTSRAGDGAVSPAAVSPAAVSPAAVSLAVVSPD